MRKLILEEWVSLDGFAADKEGKLAPWGKAALSRETRG